jgi:hypothetical protein
MILQDAEASIQEGWPATKDSKIFARVLHNAKLTLWPQRLPGWQFKHFESPRGNWPVHGRRA